MRMREIKRLRDIQRPMGFLKAYMEETIKALLNTKNGHLYFGKNRTFLSWLDNRHFLVDKVFFFCILLFFNTARLVSKIFNSPKDFTS